MSTPGNLATALASLPNWLQETSEVHALDARLLGWVRSSGWRAAGVIWPVESSPVLSKTAQGSLTQSTPVPPELPGVVRRLHQGEATATATAINGALRVYVALHPPGRPMGVFWAERPIGVPSTDLDKSLVALTGKLIAASPAFAAATGPVVDPDRLLVRIADTAVVAGRMAHDFDNILTGILGFADLARSQLPPDSQTASFVAEIGKVGQRGIQFTQQLHQLSRSGQSKPNPGQVQTAIAREETRLRPRMAANLRLEKEVPANLPPVAVESAPLHTVIGHLMENAIEACSEGGLVRISVKTVELSESDARSYLGKVGLGAHLEISIVDSGPGIKSEVRSRLFAEPFYTTKVRHRGLGLAIVYRILSVHRGGIRLEPVPPPATGTLARIVLPMAAARPPAIVAAPVAVIPVGG